MIAENSSEAKVRGVIVNKESCVRDWWLQRHSAAECCRLSWPQWQRSSLAAGRSNAPSPRTCRSLYLPRSMRLFTFVFHLTVQQ